MAVFRLMLAILLAVLTVYTMMVIGAHGMGLFPVFFGDIGAMGWPGQFNLDFLMMLMLSATWTAWRNDFSAAGLGLAVLAALLGTAFLTVYLLYLSFATRGDAVAMLVGNRRAAR